MKYKKGDIVKYKTRVVAAAQAGGLYRAPTSAAVQEGQKLRGVVLETKFANCDVDLVHVKWATIDDLDWVFEEHLCLVSNEV